MQSKELNYSNQSKTSPNFRFCCRKRSPQDLYQMNLPFFVHVYKAETDTTEDNASGTKVISHVGLRIQSLCDQREEG